MPSNLSAFPYIGERSEATPGLWNYPFSVLSANIASLSSTLDLGHFQQLSIGSTPPSYLTTAAVTIEVSSAYSDYLYLVDSSAQKSSYIIGSRAGNLADGLNIWDVSGSTMIASFSKDSIRFFQKVVGAVFDVGGALADTLNAATFGTGADSTESRIQAAISAASIAGISRVYVPANMYPYSAGSVSFDTRVQMVREGGDYGVHDARAYGAYGNNIANDTSALSGALGGVGGGKIFDVFVPPGIYRISSKLSPYSGTVLRGIAGASMVSMVNGSSSLFLQAISRTSLIVDGITWDAGSQPGWNTTSLQFDNCSDVIVRNCAFRNTKIPVWIRGSTGACQRVLIDNNNFGTVTDFAVRADEATYGTDISITRNYVTNVLTGVVASPTAFALIANRSNIRNNTVAATTDSGVIVSGAIADVNVSGNMINSTKVSIFAGTGAKRVVIANNVVSSSTDFGIDFEGSGAVSDELIVSGNVIHDCGKSGINLQDITRATVQGNTIARVGQATGNADNQRCGISWVNVSNTSVLWTTVTGNVIYDDAAVPTMRYGMLVQPTNDFTYIWGNSVRDAIALNYNYAVPTSSYFIQTDQAIRTINGTALIPVYSFGSESSLGLYRSAISTLALSYGTLGVSVLSAATMLGAQAAVGPYQANNIVTVDTDSVAGSVGLRVRGTMTSKTTDLLQVTDTGSADAISFSINSRGTAFFANRVGIGTANPTLPFEISAPATLGADLRMRVVSTSTNSRAIISLSNSDRRWDIRNNGPDAESFDIFNVSSALTAIIFDGSSVGHVFNQFMAPALTQQAPSFAFSSESSLGVYLSGVSTIAFSYGTVNLATNAVRFSMRTLAASSITASAAKTNVAVNEVVFTIGGASGASFAIYSGGTVYGFDSIWSAKAT